MKGTTLWPSEPQEPHHNSFTAKSLDLARDDSKSRVRACPAPAEVHACGQPRLFGAKPTGWVLYASRRVKERIPGIVHIFGVAIVWNRG
jgi:hypothetical protein